MSNIIDHQHQKSVALFNLDKGATNGFVKFVKILTSKRILNF